MLLIMLLTNARNRRPTFISMHACIITVVRLMKLGLFILDMVFASVTQYKPEYKKKLMNALITVELH